MTLDYSNYIHQSLCKFEINNVNLTEDLAARNSSRFSLSVFDEHSYSKYLKNNFVAKKNSKL